jgi:tyrosine-protein kinase Etk/Wzc
MAFIPDQPAGEQYPVDDDSISLLDLLDVLLEHRWWIALMTVLGVLTGGAYALLATPIYEADTLVQVEDPKSGGLGGGGAFGELSSMFNVRSPTTAEIEIIRSRLVVSRTVNQLGLDRSVEPRYLPMAGRWLSARAEAPGNVELPGLGTFITGTDAIEVESFEVTRQWEGMPFTVTLTADGYTLSSADDEPLGKGKPGVPLRFGSAGNGGQLLLKTAAGAPGSQFTLVKQAELIATEELQKRLKIAEQGRQSGIVKVSLEDPDPVLAARIINEIGSLYVRQNIERKSAEAEKSLEFLTEQLPLLRAELETAERKYNAFRSRNKVFDLSTEAKVMLDESVDLRVKLGELQRARIDLASRFTETHPRIKVVDSQLRELRAKLGALERRGGSLPGLEQELLQLTRDVKVSGELYAGLLNSYQQLRLAKASQVGNVRVVDAGAEPVLPVKPRKALVVAIASLVGLMLGLGLAFLRNAMHHGIREAGEIERQLGVSVFGSVPHSTEQDGIVREAKKQGGRLQLLANKYPEAIAVESLRSLRTALQFAMLDAYNNLLLLAGPTPGLGKSFVSSNLAAVLAAGGKRVLLVDADMRKGQLHRYFGLGRGPGLSELIAGTATPETAIHRDVAPGLDLLTTGTLPPNPAELLMSPAMARLLSELSGRYEMVMIDAPPILPVADALALAPQVGTVFLLARAEITSIGELEDATRRLAQAGAQPKGVVFNDFDTRRRRYGYGYGYGYGGYGRYRYRYKAYEYKREA